MATKRGRVQNPAEPKQRDYIPHGSEQHAQLLGIRKAEEGDSPTFKGYALVDMTTWGPNATEAFLLNVLRQKVAELGSKPQVPEDAPEMWVPQGPEGEPVRGIV